MSHNPAKGISLIDHNTAAWDHCNNFRFHVWWHKALLHLDHSEYAYVLHLYDTKIRYEKTDDYRDFSNASSLLTRLELEGVDVGNRWSELADLAGSRSEDGCRIFADLHYMLALSGDSRAGATSNWIGRVARDAKTQTEAGRLMTAPGMAAATALEPSKPVNVSETQKQHKSDTLINFGVLLSTEGADLKAGEEAGSLTPKLDQIEAVKQETRQTPPSPASLPSTAPSFLASVVPEAKSMAPDFVDEVSEFAPVASSASTLSLVDAKQILPATAPQNLPLNIARQISEATRNASDGTTEITLNPAELGRVRMSFSPTEAGMMVVLSVERPEVLELMKRHIRRSEPRVSECWIWHGWL